jgi:citrate lyase subunit beta / citryl-CoA lyase
MTVPMFRSLLFVPAISSRKIEKAFASEADGIIVDLEDSVAAAEKPAAREALAGALAAARRLPAFVRVNAAQTPFLTDDLRALSRVALCGVMAPKTESPGDLAPIDDALRRIESERGLAAGSIEILPILETARGLLAASEIARFGPRVRRLTIGAIDLALDMDVRIEEPFGAVDHARFAVALASRAAGLAPPFDTAFADFADLEGLKADALRARAFGYHGKACIHPAQLDVVNGVFTPSMEEITYAREIVEAFDKAEGEGLAAIRVRGRMVDYPVAAKARRLLASEPPRRG